MTNTGAAPKGQDEAVGAAAEAAEGAEAASKGDDGDKRRVSHAVARETLDRLVELHASTVQAGTPQGESKHEEDGTGFYLPTDEQVDDLRHVVDRMLHKSTGPRRKLTEEEKAARKAAAERAEDQKIAYFRANMQQLLGAAASYTENYVVAEVGEGKNRFVNAIELERRNHYLVPAKLDKETNEEGLIANAAMVFFLTETAGILSKVRNRNVATLNYTIDQVMETYPAA